MVEMTPGGHFQHSADELARLLTDAALTDPRLLQHPRMFRAHELYAQSTGLRTVGHDRLRSTPIQSAPLPSRSDTDEYLEQLVSIAVASAQRAEDALQSAGKSDRINRRTITAGAAIGVLGVLVGIIGIADKRLIDRADVRLTQITSEVRTLADAQQQTSGQLTQLRAQPVDLGGAPRGSSPTPVGASDQVADQDPGAAGQTAVNAVSNVETASSVVTPTSSAASAPAAALPAPPYDSAGDAPAGQSARAGDAATASSDGAPAASVAPATWVAPVPSVASTSVPEFPTQPYGRNPVVLVVSAASVDDGPALPVPPRFADVPAPPGDGPRVARPATPVRRTATWHERPPAPTPVREVRNFVVAIGDRVRGLFVR